MTETHVHVVGYHWNCVDELVLIAGPKPLLTELGIHLGLESWDIPWLSFVGEGMLKNYWCWKNSITTISRIHPTEEIVFSMISMHERALGMSWNHSLLSDGMDICSKLPLRDSSCTCKERTFEEIYNTYEKTLDISSDREWMCRSVWCADKKEESSNGMLRSTMTHVLKDLCVLSRPDSKSSLGSSYQATFYGHFHLVRKRISILVNLYDGRNSISR